MGPRAWTKSLGFVTPGAKLIPRLLVAGIAAATAITPRGPAYAQATAKTFIDYLQPAPITCSPLSSATWGVAGVLPRDTCNGIESTKGAGVPPDFFYWDGKIIKANDGTYHMFMSTWADALGFNPGWTSSESFQATSPSILGPYTRQGFVWSTGSHHGHNTSAAQLQDGSYAVIVSEVVPFTIYKSTALDGPWTACPNPTGELIQTNGIRTQVPPGTCLPGGACDTHWDSNVSLVARPDGTFEIVQRHGFIATADTLCGPYLMQKPTWTYPAANTPTVDSIYPHRTSEPDPMITNPTHGFEEDPHIWYSGCRYHVLYDSATDRIGYVLSSPDGIHSWRDDGLAFDPRMPTKMFGYVGSTVHTQWFKMERPSVVMDNGHVSHVTWAVADVDKDNSIPAASNHGSKVVVVPFDGVSYDTDTGDCGAAGAGGGGAGGAGGAGTGGTGVPGKDGGTTSGAGGATGSGGATGGAGGASTSGGAGGRTTGNIGGASGATGGSPATTGAGGTGGGSGSGGASGTGESTVGAREDRGSGCSCQIGGPSWPGDFALAVTLSHFLIARRRARRRRGDAG